MGPYSTKKRLHFLGKKTSLGKNVCMVYLFYHSKRLAKNIKQKKFVISGGGHK